REDEAEPVDRRVLTGDRDLQVVLLQDCDRRAAEAVVGREHAVDLAASLREHLLEDLAALLVVPVGNALVVDELVVARVELRLQDRGVALREQGGVVARRRAVEDRDSRRRGALGREAIDEALTLELT